MSRLSIIVPCFNSAQTVERAFNSAKQVLGDVEIVFVNDGSTDGTRQKLIDLSQEGNVVFIDSTVNRGQGAARNLAVSHATGDYLCFLDSDDEIISPDFFVDALALIEQGGYTAAKGLMRFFDPVKGYVLNESDLRYSSVVMSSACGLILKKDTFLKLGGFPEEDAFRGRYGGEDVAFMQIFSRHASAIAKIPVYTYKVWSRAGSHLDIFLSQTRLCRDGFEFSGITEKQQAEYRQLNSEIENYVNSVQREGKCFL